MRFGAPLKAIVLEDLVDPESVYTLGVEPDRVDVLKSLDGVRFATAWRNRVEVKFADVRVGVLSRADLIRSKIAAGRPQDLFGCCDAANPAQNTRRKESTSVERKSEVKSVGSRVAAILLTALAGCSNAGGCGGNDDGDEFHVVLSGADDREERTGVSTPTTKEDVFACRSTTQSPDPLDTDAFLATTSNHRITLTQAVAGLTVTVESDAEIVIWIRSETGSFCNNAEESFITRGSWSAGEYDVFIGAPEAGGEIEDTVIVGSFALSSGLRPQFDSDSYDHRNLQSA